MYTSQPTGPPSRGRRSSSVSSYTPTNRPRGSHIPNSALRNSAGRMSNDPARFSYVGNSMTTVAPSSAAKRMSSFFKTPAKQMGFKDTRNLMDREVQASMQRKVLDFLLATNYPQLNDKLVRFPTKAEFTRLLEFILLQLDPRFTFQGKVEEEMPRILRSLGYPVQLKPSTMQTIGAAHTMPHLLGAITWLIDAIHFTEKISPQDLLLSNEDDGGQRRSLAYGYMIRCYKALGDVPGCTVDPSDFKSDSERLMEILEENDEIVSTNEELIAREEAINEEMAEIQKHMGDSEKLEAELSASKEDLERVKEYQNELQQSITTVQAKQDSYSTKLANLESKLAEVKADNAAKEVQISKQKMSGETARQLRAQKAELNNQVEQLNSDMARTDSEIYDLRKIAFKEGIEMRERYAGFVRNIGSVRRCFGVKDDSFEISLQQHSPNEPNFISFLDDVKEHIVALHEEVKRTLEKIEHEKVGVQEEVKAINEQKETLKEEFSKLQHSIEVKKHYQMLRREDWTDEIRKVRLELDVAQNELSALHGARNSKATDAHEQLAAMRKLVQNRKIAINEARNKLIHEASIRLEKGFEEWDYRKECRAQLREQEKLLRAAMTRFITPFD